MATRYWLLMIAEALAFVGMLLWQPYGAESASGWASTVPVTSPRLRRISSMNELRTILARQPAQMAQQEKLDMAADAAADAPAIAEPVPEVAMVGAPATLVPRSITNNQTAGVDEGGIVKTHGNHLVVLRRGRLFTIDTAGGAMRLIDTVDAFPSAISQGTAAPEAWYDEMLVTGDMVVVIGFNYARQGTEINRFTIDEAGEMRWRDTHVLRSADYYSSENYASRLIGNELIVYTPLQISRVSADGNLPALARYNASLSGLDPFQTIVQPTNIFLTEQDFVDPHATPVIAHSVSRCDLSQAELSCDSTVVLGSWSHSFYVSAEAVYVWTSEGGWAEGSEAQSRLYRIPLQRGEPAVVRTTGTPANQFSFREDQAERRLNILVQTMGEGPSTAATGPTNRTQLLQLPLSRFSSGDGKAESGLYRTLPSITGYDVANRYVGQHLLYGGDEEITADARGIGRRTGPKLHIVPLDGGAVTTLSPNHSVDRIDIMGSDAIVIGEDASNRLIFSAVGLSGAPSVISRFVFPAASQGESRSHAFFYRANFGTRDGESGLLGLPVRRAGSGDYDSLHTGSASILYLRRNARQLSLAGSLRSRASGRVDDNCLASCLDWYGNARPIFLGDRIFALMGYELVEGRMANGQISEIGRVDFAPRGRASARQ